MNTVIILLGLIVLHTLDGTEVDVNPVEITSLREKPPEHGKLFVKGVHCLVNLSDGKFVTVIESCAQIREAITALEDKGHGKSNGGRP